MTRNTWQDNENVWDIVLPPVSHNSLSTTIVADDSKDCVFEDLLPLADNHANDEELVDVINGSWNSMKTFFKCHKVMDVLNVSTLKGMTPQVAEEFMKVWNGGTWKVKVNASIGCILVHKSTGRYRYFHSSPNNGCLFEHPSSLSTTSDVEVFLEKVKATDLQERAFRARPNTEWRLFALTNITFYLYKMIGISRAGASTKLPNYIKRNRNVVSLLSCTKTGKAFDDNLCFFRCLALMLACSCIKNRCKCKTVKERMVKRLVRQYMKVLRMRLSPV